MKFPASREGAVVTNLLVKKFTNSISTPLEKLPSNAARRRVKKLLRELTNHVEHVYMLPVEEREIYWDASFYLYDFLRQAGQFGRTTFGFSDEVKKELKKILSIEN